MSLTTEEINNIKELIYSPNLNFRELGFLQDQTQLGGQIKRDLNQQYKELLKILNWSLNQLLDAKSLTIYNKNISILALENLPYLEILTCPSSNIEQLILNNLPKLKKVLCPNNRLTQLNLNTIPQLIDLGCSNNQLTTLDLCQCPQLQGLSCSKNQLSELNISKSYNLINLFCENNNIKQLNISHLKQLDRFEYKGNPNLKVIDDLTPYS